MSSFIHHRIENSLDPVVSGVIEARYRGRGKYYPGKILRNRSDGLYDIKYDDGEIETAVDIGFIRFPLKNNSKPNCYNDSFQKSKIEDKKEIYEIGQRVKVQYPGKRKYFSGVIVYINKDNTYDIQYDSGKYEIRVLHSFILYTNQKSNKRDEKDNDDRKEKINILKAQSKN